MSAMRVKAMVVLGAMLIAAGEAGAATTYSYWDPNGSGNWSSPSRWQNGLLPADTGNVKFSDTDGFATDADFDIFAKLTRIRFGGTASLDLRFDEDHTNFSSNTVMNDGDGIFSTLIKSGTGTTVFTSTKNGFSPNRFIVTNGTL